MGRLSEAIKQYFIDLIEQGKQEVEITEANAEIQKIIKNHEQNNGWIPCNERLPNEYEEVLVYTYGNLQRVWCLIDNEDEYVWEDEFGAWNEFEDVVAWRELSEGYRGE
jgi:hypothetical protein